MGEWQPIKEYVDGNVILGGWNVVNNELLWVKSIGRVYDVKKGGVFTHYMPLPEPPTAN